MRKKKPVKRAYKRRKAIQSVSFDKQGVFKTSDPNVITLTISRREAEAIRHNIADLMCWWRGFKTGYEVKGGYTENLDFPQSGVDSSELLKRWIERELQRLPEA